MKITLGRSNNNDIIIDNRSVSNSHAIIEIEENASYILDMDSANGVFVNGNRVLKKKIDFTEQLKLGNYEVNNDELLATIHELKKVQQTDFTNEFSELETVYSNYLKAQDKVDTKEKNKIILLRILISVAFMALIYFILGKPSYMLFAGLIATMLTNIFIKPAHSKEKKEDLQLSLSDEFKCPKCKTALAQKSWKYWKKKESCPNPKCNATWH